MSNRKKYDFLYQKNFKKSRNIEKPSRLQLISIKLEALQNGLKKLKIEPLKIATA